jgi:hypothetical protein
MLPVWEENNRNEIAAGRAKKPLIRPVLIDREIPLVQMHLDELNRKTASGGEGLTNEEKKKFVEATKRLKLLTDRRAQILARMGDEYVTAPPKLPVKP